MSIETRKQLVTKIMNHVWGRNTRDLRNWDIGSKAWTYWLKRTLKEKHTLKEWKKIGMEEYSK
jgi:hypothetical protein